MMLRWIINHVIPNDILNSIVTETHRAILDYKIVYDDGKSSMYISINSLRTDSNNKIIILS